MNLLKYIFFLLGLAVTLSSCQFGEKYPYTLKDFRPAIQKHLYKILTSGIVGTSLSEDYLRKQATDTELKQLSRSEHPVLRTVALRIMLSRPAIDHFKILMAHLDDTAIVAIDIGEFGTGFTTVTDDLINQSEWKDTAERNKTIDKVLREHNYLRSAYLVLSRLNPEDKYYAYTKTMAQRDRYFGDLEIALYRLASYRKAEDVKLIKRILLQNHFRMNTFSFRLMKEYPNDAYMEVLKTYANRSFYRNLCENRSYEDAENFIDAVASYKKKESAEILQSILKELPSFTCPVDTNSLMLKLSYSIWDNQCDAYSQMINQVKPYIIENEAYNKKYLDPIEVDDVNIPGKTIRW